MSLLDTGTDVLQVFPEVEQTSGRGNTRRVPSPTGIPVSGAVHQLTSEEANALGQSIETTRKFIGRTFPAGPWARIEWGGRTWDVLGEPGRARRGSGTRHVSVILTTSNPPPLPEETP